MFGTCINYKFVVLLINVFKYRLFFVFLGLIHLPTFAQDSIPKFGAGVTYHYGFIAPHKPVVNEIVKGHTQILEISIYKNTLGERQWEQYFRNPKVGVSAMFINTGNDESLGKAYGIFPFVEMHLNKWKVNWNIRAGYGLGYIEKPFDRVDNYKNLAIGSTYNALIFVNSLWNYKFSKNFEGSLGVSLTHFSNGSLKRPNLGINIFSLNGGINYNFGNVKAIIPFNNENKDKVWNKYLILNGGVKEISPIGGEKYFVSTLSYQMIKTTSNKSGFGFAADAFYNSSLEQLMINDNNSDASADDNFRLGLAGLYRLSLGKMEMLFQTGWYLYSPYKGNGNLYTRLNSRYFVSDKFFVNLALKTHYAVADFIEYGIGYKLK